MQTDNLEDPILSFSNIKNPSIVYTSTNVNVGAVVLAGRLVFVIVPSDLSRILYPSIWKLETYHNNNGTALGSPNGTSTRPFYIAKLSELYFIATEASLMGAIIQGGKSTRELINV